MVLRRERDGCQDCVPRLEGGAWIFLIDVGFPG